MRGILIALVCSGCGAATQAIPQIRVDRPTLHTCLASCAPIGAAVTVAAGATAGARATGECGVLCGVRALEVGGVRACEQIGPVDDRTQATLDLILEAIRSDGERGVRAPSAQPSGSDEGTE